ncbi:hypothetical protein [Acrocarpospora sp. B8E8]
MLIKHIQQAADDAWMAFVELTASGFNSEEAIRLVPVTLLNAERREGK